ncbi:MAG: hypothetical protein H0W48_04850 [Methylibium sp.]|nr:hypothetical protein [Methylibium sp.]
MNVASVLPGVVPMAQALETTAPARWLQQSMWGYPVVSALHIVAIALLLGAITVVDARLLGFARQVPVAHVARAAWPFALAGVVLALGTGPLLFIVQPGDYLVNPAFFWKLLLLLAAFANVAWFHLRFAAVLRGVGEPTAGVRWVAALSIGLWLCVLFAGRMIAFV